VIALGIPVAFREASHHAPIGIVGLRVTPPRPRSEPAAELRALTGLRIVAALWVVLFHVHFTPLPGVAAAVQVLGPVVTGGALGVDLFFVLSGFVIAHTYLDRLGPAWCPRQVARFVWARAIRLWPAYAVVLHLFGLWLAARAWLGTDDDIAFQRMQPVLSGTQYLAQLTLVQLWDAPFFDGASWVGPAWSISAEWLAYLLFPVVALGVYRLRRWPAPLLALGAVALLAPLAWTYLSTGSPYYPWSWLVRILGGFGSGVLAQLAVRRLGVLPMPVRRAASVLAAVLPVLVVAGLVFGERLGPGRGGAVLVLFPLLVAALAVADRGPARLLGSGWAVFGGRISYSLYLVHIPLLEVYWLALLRVHALAAHPVLAYLLLLGVVVAGPVVAAALFRLVEEPARRRLRRPEPVGRAPRPLRVAADRTAPVPSRAVPGPRSELPTPAPRPRSVEPRFDHVAHRIVLSHML
jgi:peptidoglycan/LPS O-acetylase OafA/YrhL